MSLPVRITGQAPDLLVYPDVKLLLQDTVTDVLTDTVTDAVQNLLSPKEDEEEGGEKKKKPLERLRDRFKKRNE